MNWKNQYKNCKEYFVKNINKSPPIVTGFNANIDAVNYLDEKTLEKIGINCSSRKSVYSLQDLGRGIMESVNYGEANEWELGNEKIYDDILGIGYDEARMGGQAGIVANLMARLGVKVRVLLPLLASEQAKYFAKKNLKIATIKNNYFTLASPKQAADDSVDARINCIFEFGKGFMKSPRANRFILSFRPIEYKPLLKEQILLNSSKIFDGVKRAFISGYQLLDSNSDFRKAVSQIRFMKEFAQDAKFHLEMTNVENSGIRRNVLRVAREFHSIGCNDVELELYSNTDQIIDGMKRMVKKTGAQRLHVHTLHNHFCLLRDSYGVEPWKERDCMMMGAVVCSAKAGLGRISHKTDLVNSREIVSAGGLKYLEGIESEDGIIRMHNYSVIVIPNLHTRKVKSTVGLGDSISSTSFASEMI